MHEQLSAKARLEASVLCLQAEKTKVDMLSAFVLVYYIKYNVCCVYFRAVRLCMHAVTRYYASFCRLTLEECLKWKDSFENLLSSKRK